MEEGGGADLETIRLVEVTGGVAHLVSGVYMPTSQRNFDMPVYYLVKDEEVTMTKLSITQIDRHSYGWTIQNPDDEILARAICPNEKLAAEEPFSLPQDMNLPCWQCLSAIGTGKFKMIPSAHFEVCESPFLTLQQMMDKEKMGKSLKEMDSNNVSQDSSCERVPDSDDDASSERDSSIDAEGEVDFRGNRVDSVDSHMAERKSAAISQKWNRRLGQLVATQGMISKEVDDDGEVTLKVRPVWPEWLKDISFDVIKINKYGKRQQRKLRLTKQNILNIKDNKEVSRLHPYSQIARVYLKKSSHLVVEFNDEQSGRSLDYISNEAPQIVEQITTRIRVRNELQKLSPEALDYHTTWRNSSSKVRKPTNSILMSEKRNRDSNILEFSKSLGLCVQTLCESTSIGVTPSQLSIEEQNAVILRAVQMGPDSREFSVKRAVEEIFLDKNSPAGSTRLDFINKFQRNELGASDLIHLRHFIDGIYGYILEHHLPELVSVARHGNKLKASANFAEVNEDEVITISYIAFTAVEAIMFSELHSAIAIRYFTSAPNKAQELDTCRRLKVLSLRQQQDWGISPNHISPGGWSSAIFELAGIERNPTPSMRLQALVYASKEIYSEFKCEVLPALRERRESELSDADMTLGADDFLPIFIYVLCQTNLNHPHLNKNILWNLCHPDQLRGESGYYLTMYESAIEFVLSVEVDEEVLNRITLPESDIETVCYSNGTVFKFS